MGLLPTMLLFALWLACAAVGWRIGTEKGIDPALCVGAAIAFGPLFLAFLALLPNFDDYRPRLKRRDPPAAPAPPRDVVPATPPSARPNIELESARRLAGLGGSDPKVAEPPSARR